MGNAWRAGAAADWTRRDPGGRGEEGVREGVRVRTAGAPGGRWASRGDRWPLPASGQRLRLRTPGERAP